MIQPYRHPDVPLAPAGRRWGATRWKRFLVWFKGLRRVRCECCRVLRHPRRTWIGAWTGARRCVYSWDVPPERCEHVVLPPEWKRGA